MRTAFVFVLILGILNAFTACFPAQYGSNQGPLQEASYTESKPLSFSERVYDVRFHRLHLNGGFEVELIPSHTEKVVVTASPELQEQILVENNGQELFIRYREGLVRGKTGDRRIQVYTRNLDALEIDFASRVVFVKPFKGDHIAIRIASSGAVLGDFEGKDFRLDAEANSRFQGQVWARQAFLTARSAARIEMGGAVDKAEIRSYTLAEIHARDLRVGEAYIKANDKSRVELGVIRYAEAKTTSKAEVTLFSSGSPEILKEGNVFVETTLSRRR